MMTTLVFKIMFLNNYWFDFFYQSLDGQVFIVVAFVVGKEVIFLLKVEF